MKFTYCIIRAVYRVTGHPLAHFPGPTLRGLSHVPSAVARLRGREPFEVRDLHKIYGPVVKVDPDTLSFITAAAWNDIYSHTASLKFEKSGYVNVKWGIPDILSANKIDHKPQRRLLAPAFSENAIRAQEPMLLEHIDKLIKKLDAKVSADPGNNVVDFTHLLGHFTFDVIGDFTLSTQFDCLEKDDYQRWPQLMVDVAKAVYLMIGAKMLNVVLFPVLLFIFADIQALVKLKTHKEMSTKKVHERLKMKVKPARADVWSSILSNKKKYTMPIPQMEVNAAILLTAGSETVATTLTAALYFLAKYPKTLLKLHEDLDKFENKISLVNLGSLSYLHAVLQETLRMYPPFAGALNRAVPRGGATISGYRVPECTSVSVYQMAAYSSATNFKYPDQFLPERWLTPQPEWALSDEKDAFHPFSIGPRNCIGKTLAYIEMKLVLISVLQRYNIELVDDGFAPEKQKAFIFREMPPLRVYLSLK